MTVSLLIKLDFNLSFYYRSWVTRCLTLSGLDSGSRGLGSIAGRVIVMCFQARHFTCSVSFPTQGYTWVPTNWQGSLLRCREEGEGGTLSNVCFFFLFFIQNDEKVIEKANQLMAAVNADMPPPSGPVNIGLIVLSCLSYEISPAVWFASFASKCHTQESVCLLVFLSACCSICLSVVPLVSVGLTFCRSVCVPVCHS